MSQHLHRYTGIGGVEYRNKYLYAAISAILLISLCPIFYRLLKIDLNGYGATEFLINYEGGFVRRGGLGQLLYWFCSSTGLAPVCIIRTISFVAYVFVFWFFCRRLIREGYSWWYLCSPLVLGLTIYVIRKDYLEYAVLIGIVTCLRAGSPSAPWRVMATLLTVCGIFLHEAFIFWGAPIYILLMFPRRNRYKYGWLNILLIFIVFATFALQCIYKGDTYIARTIVDSWNDLSGTQMLEYKTRNSIGALSWNMTDTFKDHLRKNIIGIEGNISGIFWQPLFMVAIYYFCTNFLFAFRRPSLTGVGERKLAFSAVYLLTLICLMPMFLCLSCDYGRLYQYAAMAALSAFVVIPYERILSLFPAFFLRFVTRINDALAGLLKPTRQLMVLLLLFLSISHCYFSLTLTVHESVVGKTFDVLAVMTYQLFKILSALL